MTEIRFYHLLKTPEAQALPQIAMKAWQANGPVVIKAADDAAVAALNDALWAFRPEAFLPHGSKVDGNAARQPVWLTDGDDNPNGAKTLIVAAGAVAGSVEGYALCCLMLDGNDEAQVADARTLWKTYKDAGYTLSYWQQGENGWEKKA